MRSKDGGGFVRTLVAIEGGRHEGVLEVRAGEITTLLYFAQGRLVFAEEGTLGETLGRMLLREGKLSAQQYSSIIERMTEAIFESEQMRFGEAAVALGLLSLEEVHAALAHQVRRKLVGCFQYEAVELAFDRAPEPLRAVAHFPSDIGPLVRRGVGRFWSPERCQSVLAADEAAVLRLTDSPRAIADRLALPPSESRFLRGIEGVAVGRLGDLDESLDPVVRQQLLATLVLLDAARFGEASSDEPSSEERPLEPEGDPEQPPEAAPNDGPDPSARRSSEVTGAGARARGAAQLLAERLAARRQAPPRQRSAPPPDEQKQRLLAERSHQDGLRELRYGEWASAAQKLRRAAQLQPEMVEYELEASWAEYRADPPAGGGEVAAWRSRLADLAQRVLKRDRENAFGWHVRGQLEMLAGDEAKALKLFRNALRLDSNDREAERYARLLAGRTEGTGKR